MLKTCGGWWWRQMREWGPRSPEGGARGRALVFSSVAPFDSVSVHIRRGRQLSELGTFRLDPEGVKALQAAVPVRGRPRVMRLALPAKGFLEREVVLPLAAERAPGAVLAYEIDRLTPFCSANLFWTFRVEQRDRARAKLRVKLSCLAAKPLHAPLATLRQAGFTVQALEVARPAGPPCCIALPGEESRVGGRRLALRVGAGMAAAACVVAACIVPFAQQAMARQEVEAAIAGLQPRVDEVQQLQRRLAAEAALGRLIGEEQARLGDPLGVLAALTAVTPDDTCLADLSLQPGRLQISGYSASSVRLIGGLAAAPMIRNPQFTAPVTRAADRAGESFAIKADIVAEEANYAER